MSLFPTIYQERKHLLWLEEKLLAMDQHMDHWPECYLCDFCEHKEIMKREHAHYFREYLELYQKLNIKKWGHIGKK